MVRHIISFSHFHHCIPLLTVYLIEECTNRPEVAAFRSNCSLQATSMGSATRPLFPITIHSISRRSNSASAEPDLGGTPTGNRVPRAQATSRHQSQLPLHSLVIPDVPLRQIDGTRSPMKNSWREIVEQWENGDRPRGLHTPLKDWPPEWTRKENKIFAQKRNNRGLIAVEFLVR